MRAIALSGIHAEPESKIPVSLREWYTSDLTVKTYPYPIEQAKKDYSTLLRNSTIDKAALDNAFRIAGYNVETW